MPSDRMRTGTMARAGLMPIANIISAIGLVRTVTMALAVVFCASSALAQTHITEPGAARRPAATPTPEARTMKIRLTIDGRTTTATLLDHPTTRDFVALLPMTLKLDDYASIEKIAYLPRKLSTRDAPAGIDPDVGDITYYAPWGNLAIFYRDFGYATGLIRLGRLDGGVESFSGAGPVNVVIEAIVK